MFSNPSGARVFFRVHMGLSAEVGNWEILLPTLCIKFHLSCYCHCLIFSTEFDARIQEMAFRGL